jgi:hypothetical protein
MESSLSQIWHSRIAEIIFSAESGTRFPSSFRDAALRAPPRLPITLWRITRSFMPQLSYRAVIKLAPSYCLLPLHYRIPLTTHGSAVACPRANSSMRSIAMIDLSGWEQSRISDRW